MEGHVFVPFGKEGGEYATRMEETTASPALFKLWDEAIVNAIDNHRRDETQTEIRASVTKEGVFEVKNDGKTITTEVWDEEKTGGRRTPEILFGELLSGENFDDEKKRLGGGRNGIGVGPFPF